MDQKAKRKIAANAVYIITAVIVVSIMCMTLYTAFDSANRGSETGAADTLPETEQMLEGTDNEPSATPVYTPETEPPVPAAEQNTEPVEPAINDGIVAPEHTPPTYTMPVSGAIIKGYDDSVPVFSLTMNDYRVHTGLDLEAELGCAIYACSDGVISEIYADPFWGSCVTVSHGNGLTSHYMNLSAEIPQNIDVGVAVTGGTLIGAAGDTALIEMADSDHIHFEMRQDGVPVNPLSYIAYNIEAVPVTSLD
jgi:murein DD-endopeptidase MepM/ murein hydrolase activator NlpD